MRPIDARTEQRFWSLVDRGQQDECWTWNGGTYFRVGRAVWIPRRLVMHLSGSGLTKNQCVVPACENEGCVNPAHMRVMSDWSRHAAPQRRGMLIVPGPLNPLEEDRLRRRHEAGATVRELAREMNIPLRSVARILNVARGAT